MESLFMYKCHACNGVTFAVWKGGADKTVCPNCGVQGQGFDCDALRRDERRREMERRGWKTDLELIRENRAKAHRAGESV
jgi:rRNA maturation endonuclease Nob1